MCVILFSPKGNTAPTEEQIKQAFRKNPDGAGYAYCDKQGKVKFKKGFMNVDDLIEELTPLDQWTDTNLAIHFRIGTAGKNDEYTCHPFLISNKFADLRKLEGEGAVLFHNGVLDTGGVADPLSSDTQDFTIAYAPMLAKYNKSKTRDRFIESAVVGSRLLCMYDNNKVKMFGDWKKSDDGNLLVSNKLWENSYYSYGYGGYAYANDYDRWYGYGKTTQTPQPTKSALSDKELTITNSTSTPAKITPQSLFQHTKDEVELAWEKLKREKFLWLDDYALFEDMLDTCDELNSNYVIKDGIMYFYEEDDMYMYDASLDGYLPY